MKNNIIAISTIMLFSVYFLYIVFELVKNIFKNKSYENDIFIKNINPEFDYYRMNYFKDNLIYITNSNNNENMAYKDEYLSSGISLGKQKKRTKIELKNNIIKLDSKKILNSNNKPDRNMQLAIPEKADNPERIKSLEDFLNTLSSKNITRNIYIFK